MNNKIDVINTLSIFAKQWPNNIKLSKKTNIPLQPSNDIGSMGEVLVSVLKNIEGTGQTGYSFDIADGSEVKSNSKLQSKECNKCKTKNSFFNDKCIRCGEENFKFFTDTRYSINSKEHFENFNEMGDYYFNLIEPVYTSKLLIELNFTMFLIKKDNQYFNLLLRNQLNSNKSKVVNLLPMSFDFINSNPIQLISCNILINLENDEVFIKDIDLDDKKLKIPVNILKKQELKIIFDNEKIYFDDKYPVRTLLKILEDNNIKYVNYTFQLRNKSLGKERGLTKRRPTYK